MEDKKIIGLFFARDEDALIHTEKKYSGYLFTIAYNILRDREDSSECVNDTYLKAWNTIPPKNPEKLSYYLGGLAREISIDRLRKRKSKKRSASEYELSLDELTECIPSREDVYETAEMTLLAELLGKFLRGCEKEEREMFVCRYYFCDSIKSISRTFGGSESKVKSKLFRTRKSLREFLEKEGYTL